MKRLFIAALLAACQAASPGDTPVRPVPGAETMYLVRDPGPPPHEAPPVDTLYVGQGTAARQVARVVSVAPGGRAFVDASRRLVVEGELVDTSVEPGLSVSSDGTVAYVKSDTRPETDVWLRRPGRAPQRLTHDGRSERPFFLPDGRLLWTSSAGTGRVGWFLEGKRLNTFPEARVPAFPERTTYAGGRVIFDAGDGLYTLDPETGRTERLP